MPAAVFFFSPVRVPAVEKLFSQIEKYRFFLNIFCGFIFIVSVSRAVVLLTLILNAALTNFSNVEKILNNTGYTLDREY
jgi:hypothetical protein